MSSTSLPYHESENDGVDFGGAPFSDDHSLYVHLPIISSRQQAPREKGNVYFIPSTAQHNRNAGHHLTNGGNSRCGPGLEARQNTEQHRQGASNKGRAQMGRENTRERIEHLGDTNRTVRGGAQRHIQYNPSAPQSLRHASVHMFNHGTSKNRTEHKCEREGKEQYIQGKQDMIDFSQCKNERKELRTEERRNFTNSKLKPFEPSHMHCSPASSHNLRNGNVHMLNAEILPMNGATVKEQHEQSCYESKQHRGESMQAYTEWDQSRRGSLTERQKSMNGRVDRWETLHVRSERTEHPRYDKKHDSGGHNEQRERTNSTKARSERRLYPSAAIDYYREAAKETRRFPVFDEEETCFEKWHDRILGVLLGLEGIVNCPVFCLSFAFFMASIEAYKKGKKKAYRILIVITWVSIIAGLLMWPIIIPFAVAWSRKSHVRAGH